MITTTLAAATLSLDAQDSVQTPSLDAQDVVQALSLEAQDSVQVLGREDCRQMAIRESSELDQVRTQKEMAHYDTLIVRANNSPNISARVREREFGEKNLSPSREDACRQDGRCSL